MFRGQRPVNVKTAEKLFNRKASPQTQLRAKEFLAARREERQKKIADKAFSSATQFGSHLRDNVMTPRAGAIQEHVNKKKDVSDNKKLDKKLKGFKYGVGVGH